jgi:hypothetical protein
VLVVAPALNSRLRHYVSDSDAADGRRPGARRRGGRDARRVRRGSARRGRRQPIRSSRSEDALHAFPASAIVISTYPEGHSNWLERDLPRRAEERFGRPVVHLVSRFGLAAA